MKNITDRIDATTEIGPEYLHAFIPAPKSIKIELTNKCNLSCSFCSHGSLNTVNKEMPWYLYTKIIDEVVEAGVEEVGLFYVGEPFMTKWLAKAVKYAKDAGVGYVFITTNGTLATADRIEPLLEAGIDSIKFSFNSANPEQFRKITGAAPKFWDKIIENIKTTRALIEIGEYKTRLYASSIRYDGEQQAAMEAAVARIRPFLDEHYWLPLYSFGAQASEREKELGWRPGAGNQGRLDKPRDPLPCWAVFKEAHVTVDGMLSACCFDADNKWAMADLNRVSFSQGWNSSSFSRLRAAHLNMDVHGTPCESCIYGTKGGQK